MAFSISAVVAGERKRERFVRGDGEVFVSKLVKVFFFSLIN